MQILKKGEKVGIYCFHIAILIHLSIMCEEFSIWEMPLRGRLLQLAFVLGAVKIVTTYYEKYEWILMGLVGALSVAGYLASGEKYIAYVAVMIFAAKSVDMRAILNYITLAVLLSIIIVPVLALTGVGGVVVDTRDYGRGIVESRYPLGFNHANNLHGTLWYLFAMLTYIFKDRADWRHYAGMAVINAGLFYLTRSRAGFIVTGIIILAGFAYRYWKEAVFDRIWIYIAGMVAFLAVIVLTVISVSVDCFSGYGPVLKKLDSITTGRLSLAYQSAFIGEWKPLSQGGSHAYAVDNGFAGVPADYGYIAAIVFIAFIIWLMIRVTIKREGILFMIVLTAVLYTFMEKTYVINDAYMLSNLMYVVAMILLGNAKNETEKHQA